MKINKIIPWITVLAVLKALLEHYLRLSDEDRERVGQVLRESKGLPNRISAEHKQYLRAAALNLDKMGLGKDLLAAVSPLPNRLRKRTKSW